MIKVHLVNMSNAYVG